MNTKNRGKRYTDQGWNYSALDAHPLAIFLIRRLRVGEPDQHMR
jgi:hypothetical protein